MDYRQLVTRLQQDYERVCDQYIDAFCEKHDKEFEGWVGKKVGEVAVISGYALDFTDIKYDIDHLIKPDIFWEWLLYTHDLLLANLEGSINYEHYCLGCPLPYSRAEINERYKANNEQITSK